MTFPDNRTESLPHEHAIVNAARSNGELVLEEIQSTRLAWLLSESSKVPIDYATEVKNLWNLFDKRIGKPPDIGEVEDEQQARRALWLMEDALTALLTHDDLPPSDPQPALTESATTPPTPPVPDRPAWNRATRWLRAG